MTRFLTYIVLLTSCFMVSGCLQTHKGLKPRDGDPYARRFKKDDEIDLPRSWSRVGSGIESKPNHVGYMSTEQTRVEGEIIPVFWVYDLQFNKVGFFLERGETYRKDRFGKFKSIGVFRHEKSLAYILDAPTPINFYTMAPPEGSDVPYQDPFRRGPAANSNP